jgi:hypothetical protein
MQLIDHVEGWAKENSVIDTVSLTGGTPEESAETPDGARAGDRAGPADGHAAPRWRSVTATDG